MCVDTNFKAPHFVTLLIEWILKKLSFFYSLEAPVIVLTYRYNQNNVCGVTEYHQTDFIKKYMAPNLALKYKNSRFLQYTLRLKY